MKTLMTLSTSLLCFSVIMVSYAASSLIQKDKQGEIRQNSMQNSSPSVKQKNNNDDVDQRKKIFDGKQNISARA